MWRPTSHHRPAIAAGVFAAALSLGFASVAAAQGGKRPSVAAVCIDQSGQRAGAAASLCGHLGGWLARSERWQAVSVDRALVIGGEFDPVTAVIGASELLEGARASYNTGKRKEGLRQFERAAEALIALEPWLEDRALLAVALLELIAAQIEVEREDWKADQTAVRLFNFVPSMREAWRRRVRPGPLFDRLEKISRYVEEQTRGELTVSCSGVDACEVYVDGRFKGVTPLTIGDIRAGEHLVRVRKAGWVPTSRVLAIVPDQPVKESFTLERAQGQKAYSQILERLPAEIGAARAGSALDDLRGLLIVDQAVAVRTLPADDVGLATVEAHLYDLRSGQLLAAVDVSQRLDAATDYEALAVGLMEELIAAQERTLAAADPTEKGEAPFLGGVLNKWWFWTGVGAVVVGAATTAIVLSADGEGPAGPPADPGDPNAGTIRLTF